MIRTSFFYMNCKCSKLQTSRWRNRVHLANPQREAISISTRYKSSLPKHYNLSRIKYDSMDYHGRLVRELSERRLNMSYRANSRMTLSDISRQFWHQHFSSTISLRKTFEFSDNEHIEGNVRSNIMKIPRLKRSSSTNSYLKYREYPLFPSPNNDKRIGSGDFSQKDISFLELLTQLDLLNRVKGLEAQEKMYDNIFHKERRRSTTVSHRGDESLHNLTITPAGTISERTDNVENKNYQINENVSASSVLNEETGPSAFSNDTNHDAVTLMNLLSEQENTLNQLKYKDLQRLQLQLEIESTEEALDQLISSWKASRDRSSHSDIPAIRNELTSWYASLTSAIELEQWLYLNGDNHTWTSNNLSENGEHRVTDLSNLNNSKESGPKEMKNVVKDRTNYGPLLCLLPPQKIATLLAQTALSCSVIDGQLGTKVVSLAMHVAQALEMEVNVSRALRVRASKVKKKLSKNMDTDGDQKYDGMEHQKSEQVINVDNALGNIAVEHWVYTASHLQKFLNEISNESGQSSLKSKGRIRPALVRKRCQQILLREGFLEVKESTGDDALHRSVSKSNFSDWDPVQKVKLGAALIRLLLDHTTYSKSNKHQYNGPEPAFVYSRRKTGDMRFNGFISLHPELLHIATTLELSPNSSSMSLRATQNNRCQPMIVPPKGWVDINDGGYETIKDAIRNADLSTVFDGLNVLGNIPWKVNREILDVACKCWEKGIVLGDIPPQVDYEVPPLPTRMSYSDWSNLDEKTMKELFEARRANKDAITKHLRMKQKNMDLHSLRCSAVLKLKQAKKFREFDEIFFPYNVDFRGRAYPVPPHLSIVGSDLCRGLLMFAHSKPLGSRGLYWLKVHLANLAGANKMSFDGRAQFVDDNMHNVRAAVDDPFGENNWWMKFDDPFQGLATCHEIVKAIDSGSHENYNCSLPVHMDGSCNGLQHYAALGRDVVGGKAVNLCVADGPQDVYIGVMHEVIRRVALDAEQVLPFDENKSDLSTSEKKMLQKVKAARLVNGLIDRGVVKRTVMTSVYGVTYIGAKNQISEKIEEKLESKGYDIDEMEAEIHWACGYLATLTMEVMGQLFTGARRTMNWLTACARLISDQGQPVAFISPIGVPVVQPYRQKRPMTVITLLQNIILTHDSDLLPLNHKRQVSAFPPNFVHSLDSSHMLLTAIEMQKRGLYFSAVHDSYWTHPCDIEEMNVVLRECFIDLYKKPLLEDLKKMWELRYPSITFPDVPERGDLDLNDVRSAPYFFQ